MYVTVGEFTIGGSAVVVTASCAVGGSTRTTSRAAAVLVPLLRVTVKALTVAMVVLLQAYTGTSDAQAVELAIVDARWQMVLGILGEDEAPFSQGALPAFRQRLIAHDMDRRLLERHVTDQVYTVVGGKIAVWCQPVEVRAMYADGRWTPEQIAAQLDSTVGTEEMPLLSKMKEYEAAAAAKKAAADAQQ